LLIRDKILEALSSDPNLGLTVGEIMKLIGENGGHVSNRLWSLRAWGDVVYSTGVGPRRWWRVL
jgi:hypothetical protein